MGLLGDTVIDMIDNANDVQTYLETLPSQFRPRDLIREPAPACFQDLSHEQDHQPCFEDQIDDPEQDKENLGMFSNIKNRTSQQCHDDDSQRMFTRSQADPNVANKHHTYD